MLWSIYKEHIYSQKIHKTKPIVTVENVMILASVDQKIDLNVITQTFLDLYTIYTLFKKKKNY